MQHSLREKVFLILEEDIINGKYRQGQKLTEAMLSKDLGVSRTPIREALGQLEIEGLVEITPNKSIVVKGVTQEDIEDIYEIRELIEGLAAKKATQNITLQETEKMGEIIALQEFYTGRNDVNNLVKMDDQFHETLFLASKSKTLSHILIMFHHTLKKARSDSFARRVRANSVLSEHKAIYEAILRKDGKMAEKLAGTHVKNAKNRLLGK
ncbi:MAG: GntR family transcriptional regulator [Clostridia bacterium]